jgi:hypothetical protein
VATFLSAMIESGSRLFELARRARAFQSPCPLHKIGCEAGGVCGSRRSETFHTDCKTSCALPSPSDIGAAFLSRIGIVNVLLRSMLLPELRRLVGSLHNDNSPGNGLWATR